MNLMVGSQTIPTFVEIKKALVFGSRLYKWFAPKVCKGMYLKISAMNEVFNPKAVISLAP